MEFSFFCTKHFSADGRMVVRLTDIQRGEFHSRLKGPQITENQT